MQDVEMMHPKKVFSRIGFALFSYLLTVNVVFLALEFICFKYFAQFYNSEYYTLLSSTVVQYGIGLPVCFVILKKLPDYRYKPQMLRVSTFFGCIALLSACATAGTLMGEGVNSFLGETLGKEITNPVDELMLKCPLWLIFVVVVIIGPIVEELIFRRFIIDKVRPYGEILAVVFSGAVFGAFHGNFSQFFYAAFVGMVLAYIYLKTMRFIYPALLHIIFNFLFGFLPVVIQKYFAISEEAALNPSVSDLPAVLVNSAYSIFIIGITILGIVFFFLKKKDISFLANYYEIPKGQRFKYAVLNPGVILLGVFCLSEFLLYIFM